jgi:hypothetical protein
MQEIATEEMPYFETDGETFVVKWNSNDSIDDPLSHKLSVDTAERISEMLNVVEHGDRVVADGFSVLYDSPSTRTNFITLGADGTEDLVDAGLTLKVGDFQQAVDEAVDYDPKPTFVEYVDELVHRGGYKFTVQEAVAGLVRIAEHDDGSGYVPTETIDAIAEDGGVSIQHIDDGWLYVSDER